MADANIGIRLGVEGADQVNRSLGNIERGVAGLGASLSKIGNIASGLAALPQIFNGTVGAVVKMADSVTILNNQLKLATTTAANAQAAYQGLFEIAQRSRVSFTELGGTFSSIARAGESLGISQQRLLGVTESLSAAIAISGGSAESAKASLIQLSQGLASGTLRGDELNSVMEQTPRLAKALADGLGVSTGALRKMGEAGEITAEKVIKALESQSATLKGELANSVLTVGQAWTQVENATTAAVGIIDKATGASSTLASGLSGLSGVITSVGQAFENNKEAISVTLGVLAGAATAAGIGYVVSGIVSMTISVGGLSGAIATLNAVLLANPVTLTLLGIGATVGGGVALYESRANSIAGLTSRIGDLKDRIKELDDEVVANGGKTTAAIDQRRAALAKLNDELSGKLRDKNIAAGSNTPGGASAVRGVDNEIERQEKALYDRRLAAKKAFDKEYSTSEQKANEEIKKQRELMGDLFTSADEARIRDKFKVGKEATDELKKALGVYNDMIAKSGGLNADFAEKWDALSFAFGKGKISLEQLTAAQAELLKEQQFSKDIAKEWEDQTKASNKAVAESVAEYGKYVDGLEKSAKAVADQVQKLEDEEEAIRLSKIQHISLSQAIEQVNIARLKELQLIELKNGNQEAADAIAKEIRDREKLAKLIGSKEAREKLADEAKKNADDIEKSLTDALMRGFENGKGFADNFRDTVVNAFQTMVLRPAIKAVIDNVSGVEGAPSIGSTIGDSIGKIASVAKSLESNLALTDFKTFSTNQFYDVGGSLTKAGFEKAGNLITENASQLGGLADKVGQIGGYVEALSNFKDGSYGQSIGQGVGTYFFGPIGGQIGKTIGSFVDKLFGGGEYVQSLGETVATITADKVVKLGGSGGNNDTSIGGGLDIRQTDLSNNFVNGLAAAFVAASTKLGISSAGASFGAGFNNSDGGKFALETKIGGKSFDPGQVKYTDENLQLQASRAIFFALQNSELPGYLSKVFDGLVAESASQKEIDNAIAFAGTIKEVRDALTETRTPLQILQESVDSAFTTLGTSAATFKTDFVAAIDAGISPESLAQYLTLGQNLVSLAEASGTASTATKTWQDKIDLLTGKITESEQERANALRGASEETAALINTYYDLKSATTALKLDFVELAAAVKSAQTGVGNALQAIRDYGTSLEDTIDSLRGQAVDNLEAAKSAYSQALAAAETYYDGLVDSQKTMLDRQVEIQREAAAKVETATSSIQSALGSLSDAAKSANEGLAAALVGVVDAIVDAAKAVETAQAGVEAARVNITKGYNTALDAEKAIKKKINDNYFSALDAVADATAAAADTMRGALSGLKGTLSELSGGGGNSSKNYAARRAQFEQLSRAALSGDTEAIGKLSAAGNSFIEASKGGASTSAQFQSDRLGVSTTLGKVLEKFGNVAATETESPLVKAQNALAAATALATSGGVDLVRSQEDLAGELADAVIEVAKWSSAITTSGASANLVSVDLLGEYNDAIFNLKEATKEQTKLTEAARVLDLTGIQASVSGFDAVIKTAISAQTTADSAREALSGAVTKAAAVGVALDAIITPLGSLDTAISDLIAAKAVAEAVGKAPKEASDLAAEYATLTADLVTLGTSIETTRTNIDNYAEKIRLAGISIAAPTTAIDALGTAVTNLKQADTDYKEVHGEMYTGAKSLVDQYGLAVTAMEDFIDRTDDLDYSSLTDLDPLGVLLQDYASALETLYDAQTAQTAAQATPAGQVDALYVSQLGRHLESGTFENYYRPLLDAGATMADVLTSIKNTALISDWSNLTKDQKVDWLKTQGSTKDFSVEYLRSLFIDGSHATGLARVPYNGYIAQLHEGEAVIPKAYNPWASGSLGGDQMETLVNSLIQEVKNLRYEAQATAVNTGKQARILERVAGPNGDSLQTVAA